jgi:dihydrofolate reductase
MNSLKMIWAQSQNGIIGNNGKMPWHYKSDMQHFTKYTMNKTVIMGRITWDSLYIKPLPNRRNIIITRQNLKNLPNGVCVSKNLLKTIKSAKNPVIIGGLSLYNECIKYADELMITIIQKDFFGDTSAPKIPSTMFRIVSNTTKTESDGVKLQFNKYKKCN